MKSKFPSTTRHAANWSSNKMWGKEQKPNEVKLPEQAHLLQNSSSKIWEKSKNPRKSSFPQPTSKADMLQIQADMLQSKLQHNMRKKSKTQWSQASPNQQKSRYALNPKLPKCERETKILIAAVFHAQSSICMTGPKEFSNPKRALELADLLDCRSKQNAAKLWIKKLQHLFGELEHVEKTRSTKSCSKRTKTSYGVMVDEFFEVGIDGLHFVLGPQELVVWVQHERELVQLRLIHHIRHWIDVSRVDPHMPSGATQPFPSLFHAQSLGLCRLRSDAHWPRLSPLSLLLLLLLPLLLLLRNCLRASHPQ